MDKRERHFKDNSAVVGKTVDPHQNGRTGTDRAHGSEQSDEPAIHEEAHDGALAIASTTTDRNTQSVGLTILPWAVLTEADLAQAFQKHPVTIRRAVERGELPEPVRLMGKPTWTGAIILKHLEGRLARTRDEAQIFQRHRATFPKDLK